MADKKTVNIRQLSKIMQVSQVTLRDWVSKGMPAKRTDRGYLCNPDEVFKWREQYLAEKKQNSEGYGQARTERMIWLARQSQLNYERESGKLVDASEVRQAAFETARMTRDAILAVPDRVASLLAGEISASGKIDKTRVHEILGKELRQALENLSNNLNRPEGVNGKKN
ncbi:MAG: hypothetical protein L6Q53_03225 [Candidatus Brocadia sinica]|nr:hypothetical protein [Candidatus Brocadia sinica]